MSIQKGDLVMVVKPTVCCENTNAIGIMFIAIPETKRGLRCVYCATRTTTGFFINDATGHGFLSLRLTKIDPPAEGDSLPTRADIEVPA